MSSYIFSPYQLLKFPPLRMILELEQGDGSTHRLVLHVHSLLGLLPRLVLLVVILVDSLEVVQHPSIVGRLASGLPPGDDLVTSLAPGQVLGPLLLGVKGPDATSFDPPHCWTWLD